MNVKLIELRINALVDSEDQENKEGAKYEVRLNKTSYGCTCPDFKYRSRTCKHIIAVLAKICDNVGMKLVQR